MASTGAADAGRDDGARSGRRLCEVHREPPLWRLPALLAARRATAPSREPGQFYMLATERHWEERGGRAPSCPARLSVADAEADASDGVRLDFLIEGGRAGDRAALRARGGGAGLGQRAARQRLFRSRGSSRRAPPARSSSAAASASRRWRSCAAASRRAAFRPRSCSASATAAIRAASTTSSPTARSASPATTATSASAATSPTCWRRCWRATTPPAPRLLLRPAGDARGGPGDVRGARGRLRAGARVADGLRLRRLLRLRGPARRGRLHAPLRRRPGRRAATDRRGDRMPELAGSSSSTR